MLFDIVRYPNKCLANQLDLGDRQTDVHEGLKGDRYVIAVSLGTFDSALELSMHEIDNN